MVHKNREISDEDFIGINRRIESGSLIGAVTGVVVTKEEKIVLIRRTKSLRGLALPGGGVEVGESFENAFIREVREETGLEVEILLPIWLEKVTYTSACGSSYSLLTAVFLAKQLGGQMKSKTSQIEARPFQEMSYDDLILEDAEKVEEALCKYSLFENSRK